MEYILNDLGSLTDWAILLLRLLMALVFVSGATSKVKTGIPKFAKDNNVFLPLAYIVTAFEFFGGIMMGVGIFPRVAATMIIPIMLVAIYKHIFEWKSPYWAQKGGYEYDIIWLSIAFFILSYGGGTIVLVTL